VFRRIEETDGNANDDRSIYQHTGLVDRNGGQHEKYRKSSEEIKGIRSRAVREFYERQNMILDNFEEVDKLLDSTPARTFSGLNCETTSLLPQYTMNTKDEETAKFAKWTVNVNMLINVILFAGKLAVVLVSQSISLVASLVDSGMDLLSTLILFGASRAIESKHWQKRYPVGIRRAEPMGVVVFSVFMISSFVQVLIESCERLMSRDLKAAVVPLQGVVIMVITIVVKFGVWYSTRGSKSSTVQALSQDAENDVIFNFFLPNLPIYRAEVGYLVA